MARVQTRVRGSALQDAGTMPVIKNAGAPTNGTSGTLAGKAQLAQLVVDTTNKKLYINTGTVASPTWTVVGTQS